MRITRRGANRYTGETVLVREKGEKTYGKAGQQNIAFNQKTKQIKIEVQRVENFDKSGEYDFVVSLTLDDLAKILEQLAGYGFSESSSEINLALKAKTSRTALSRLLVCAEGYTSSKLPTPKREI